MKKIVLFLFFTAITFAQNEMVVAEKFQAELNKSYADSLKSPLTKEDLKQFKGLDFFPIDKRYIVEAIFIRTKREKSFKMKTTTSRTQCIKSMVSYIFQLTEKN